MPEAAHSGTGPPLLAGSVDKPRAFHCLERYIAVGMPVTRHPPRRSVLALLTHTAPRSDQLRRSEALRTAIGPWHTSSPARCRARARPHDVLLAPRPSLPSLRRRFPLFVRWFTGTMAWSDSSATYMSAVRLSAFSDRSRSDREVTEVSRFSCMLFLDVLRFSDYAGSSAHSRSNADTRVACPLTR